ncbi:MAG: sensor histidine kinase [Arenimonas sp.]
MPRISLTDQPINILWRTVTLVSMVLAGEGLALVLSLTPGFSTDRWVYFGLSSLLIQWILLLTLSSLHLIKDRIAKYSVSTLSWIGLTILILSTWLVCGTCWYVYHRVSQMSYTSGFYFLFQCTAIAITIGVLGLIALQHHWRTHQLALANKQAELDALQARIQPHFLFNTLNTCAALVHQNPEQAEHLLLDLSELFRAALSESKLISLDDELTLARRYLEIEALRFGDRIKIKWQLPNTIPAIELPALSIQPLVENAVRHGIEPSENGGDIEISVQQENELLSIIVSNSLPKTTGNIRKGHHIGLASTRERIENYSDGKGQVITAIKNGRFEATILLAV